MKAGYKTSDHYSEAEKTTAGLTLGQAARKAGMKITFGIEHHCYLDGVPMSGRTAREKIGKKLLTQTK